MNRTSVIALAACLLLGGAALSNSKEQDKAAYNVALGRRVFTEIYGEGKVSLIDQLYADDFVDDSPGGGKGRELIKEAVMGFHQAFPDLHIEIEDVFAAGDKVVIRYVAHGTQTGAFNGIPPTGKTGNVRGITIFLIANGKIATEWTEYDRLGLLRQLGGCSFLRDLGAAVASNL
jgi:steroid delta-isomerase-like uncharacterized protein